MLQQPRDFMAHGTHFLAFHQIAIADRAGLERPDQDAAVASDTVREQLLRKATEYMTAVYGLRWAGIRKTDTQALDWPRLYVPRRETNGTLYLSDTSVPVAIQRACAELAVRASSDDLAPDVGAQVKQEVVGPISVTYADGARQDTRYALVDSMLAAYLKGAGQIPVVRS
jgi:hypothetical protein